MFCLFVMHCMNRMSGTSFQEKAAGCAVVISYVTQPQHRCGEVNGWCVCFVAVVTFFAGTNGAAWFSPYQTVALWNKHLKK